MSTLRFENPAFGAWDCLVSWQQNLPYDSFGNYGCLCRVVIQSCRIWLLRPSSILSFATEPPVWIEPLELTLIWDFLSLAPSGPRFAQKTVHTVSKEIWSLQCVDLCWSSWFRCWTVELSMRNWGMILLRSLKLNGVWLPKDLLSTLFQEVQAIEDVILSKLLRLYFNDDLEISPRLQQCLSVVFNNYSVLSAANKKCVSKAFIPVMRSEWPGIFGSKGVSAAMISAKKRATQ